MNCKPRSLDTIELCDLNFCAINEEGQYEDYNQRVFNIDESVFQGYQTSKTLPFFDIRRSLSAYSNWNVVGGPSEVRGIKKIYRKCPIKWGELSYLRSALPRRPGGTNIAYMEHNIASQFCKDDLSDGYRYNSILKQNIKAAFLVRDLELQEGITGFFRNPLTNTNAHNWHEDWSFLETNSMDLPAFVAFLSHSSNSSSIKFFGLLKSEIRHFQKSLKLDDTNYWRDEPGVYIEHLRNLAKLNRMSFNLAYSGLTIAWNHLLRAQIDLSKLLEQLLNK